MKLFKVNYFLFLTIDDFTGNDAQLYRQALYRFNFNQVFLCLILLNW